MTPWYLCAAFLLDIVLGDPRNYPHPVRIMGRVAGGLEKKFYNLFTDPLWGGVFAATILYCGTILTVWLLLLFAGWLHPTAASLMAILLLYSSFATRDLYQHGARVYHALRSGELNKARTWVGWMVGRDTENLSEREIVRAGVESLAESITDGIVAPLFYAAIFGVEGAMLYKAVNTLDSMWGYKNSRYLRFGRFAARVDDLLGFIPARISAVLILLAGSLIGLDFRRGYRVWLRDCTKHSGVNPGHSEAAMAGVMGVQLGGLNFYSGVPKNHPLIGEDRQPLRTCHIREACNLVVLSATLMLLVAMGLCFFLYKFHEYLI